jgi:FkbM family methyltransferase
MRAVGYVRASATEAASPDLDPGEQRRVVENFAAERGWTMADVLEDVGPNAQAGRRPGLKRLIAELDAVETVVVARLDRLGGSAHRVLGVLDRLAVAGVGLVSVQEGLETGSPPRSGVRELLAVAASWERGERVVPRAWQAGRLESFGFRPETVVDVGAADGTIALNRAFPAARHVMIEPLAEYENDLVRLAAETGADYLPTAVGRERGTVVMLVDRDNVSRSSPLSTSISAPESVARREVPITTLDALMEAEGWKAPFGLKIDTQGYELQVLEGAAGFLRRTEFVITEVPLVARLDGAASSREIIGLLSTHGFEVLDILQAPASWADVLLGRKRSE